MGEQKKQQSNPTERQGQPSKGDQSTDPSQRREGQSGTGTERERSGTGTGTDQNTETETTETRNRPEGDVEGI